MKEGDKLVELVRRRAYLRLAYLAFLGKPYIPDRIYFIDYIKGRIN